MIRLHTAPATESALRLFHEGTLAFAEIERAGIRVDVDYLEKSVGDIKRGIEDRKREVMGDEVWAAWRKRFGAKANPNSRQQLAEVVFRVLKLGKEEFTEKGTLRADESALESCDHPFVKKYLALMKLEKAHRTYIRGMVREVTGDYLHPFFNLNTVETYRSSSSDINFHNLPNRNKMIMGVIRRSIIPRPGNVLAEVDYGALEFKIAACKWRDDNMVSYASDDSKDIHRDQTAINYLCEPSDVSKEMRSIGKNKFVFPILYGSYYISCARDLWDAIGQFDLKLKNGTPLISHLQSKNVTERGDLDPRVSPSKHTFVHAVKRAEDRFYEAFPTFASAKEEWWAEYLKKGYFSLMTGFVCGGQSYSRNNLMNTDIQGPGFHCLLQSIVWMQRWLRKHKFKTKIVAQIHDCILFDGPRSELQDVLDRAEYYMTVKLAREWDWLIVPMTVEVDVVEEGQTWADKKPYTKQNGLWKTK